ncbi:hypothetical protein SNOG_11818 [Parastagonospora nodorum SN15]|uniref:Uncharacterized protein n=1 Tax=Phaeosphaeria nodorum (strain SN15 / ATCC MYA-4574 / FGSC 10173) TaxID=321614 RepID=Q0U8U6_PHANO|nr:hypothetical protein SNOG_11818 [Parastagonospora nodorum SN15]EAT80862.1 hypothetical protein SNOG_11818 [Parastagonospora nodorum SN15]
MAGIPTKMMLPTRRWYAPQRRRQRQRQRRSNDMPCIEAPVRPHRGFEALGKIDIKD